MLHKGPSLKSCLKKQFNTRELSRDGVIEIWVSNTKLPLKPLEQTREMIMTK